MRDCLSYNRPDLGGTVPARVLAPPDWADRESLTVGERESGICVDACIADAVQTLWAAGIWTRASCCGHGALHPDPRLWLADIRQGDAAARVLSRIDNRDWRINE